MKPQIIISNRNYWLSETSSEILVSRERGIHIGQCRQIYGDFYFCREIKKRLFGILMPKVYWGKGVTATP